MLSAFARERAGKFVRDWEESDVKAAAWLRGIHRDGETGRRGIRALRSWRRPGTGAGSEDGALADSGIRRSGVVGLALLAALVLEVPIAAATPSTATADPVTPPGVFVSYNTPESKTSVLLRGAVNPHNSPITDCRIVYGPEGSDLDQEEPCSPNSPAINEVQVLDIRAGAGQFRLRFGGQTTNDIPFNAPATLIDSELRALSSIGSPNVKVSGGPAEPKFHHPYFITFEGPFAGQDVEEITAENGTTPLSGEEGSELGTTTQINGGYYGPAPFTARLTSLDPGRTYQFKVLATNAIGTTSSQVETFTPFATQGPQTCANQIRREEQGTSSVNLSECRAWELVSPAEKNGGDVLASSSNTRVSLDGDHAQFTSLQAFGDARGLGAAAAYLASRNGLSGTQGWATHSLFPQVLPTSALEAALEQSRYLADFSQDLSKGVLTTSTPLTEEPQTAGVQNLYLREDLLSPGSDVTHLLTPCPVCAEPGGSPLSDPVIARYSPEVQDATSDLGQVLISATRNLTADAPPQNEFTCSESSPLPERFHFALCAYRLYESDHGILRLAGRVPPSGETECDDAGADPCVGAPESIAGSAGFSVASPNTISADGSKVFFSVPTENVATAPTQGILYMRVNHSATVELNASERSDCLADPSGDECSPGPALYLIASTDGSHVFFSTFGQQLTDDPCQSELYVYDTRKPASDPHNLTCVYQDEQPSDGIRQPLSVLGTSRDGTYLYFAAVGAIIPGQSSPGRGAAVYVWHNGSIDFVASTGGSIVDLGNGATSENPQTARVTPDGRTLLFTVGNSTETENIGPTGYDQSTNCGAFGGSSCYELYLYRADRNALNCVSCNPSGAPATADASMQSNSKPGGLRPSLHQNQPMTDDGDHVFFETGERLVSEDTNATVDVYEYNVLEGSVHLISSGTSPHDSHFLESSPNGEDVFFTTDQRLLGWDEDESYDLYDARAGGGLPEPAAVPAPCSGSTSCHSPAQDSPPYVSASTETFSGPPDPRRRRHRPRKGHRHKKHAKRHVHRQHKDGNNERGSGR